MSAWNISPLSLLTLAAAPSTAKYRKATLSSTRFSSHDSWHAVNCEAVSSPNSACSSLRTSLRSTSSQLAGAGPEVIHMGTGTPVSSSSTVLGPQPPAKVRAATRSRKGVRGSSPYRPMSRSHCVAPPAGRAMVAYSVKAILPLPPGSSSS